MSSSGTVADTGREAHSDSELVARVRTGDDRAFEELYHRYNHRIRAFVYRRLRDPGRAEDVTQEAFLSALRRMRATDSDIAFKPWLFEIARNAAIDVHRRTSRTEEVQVDEHALVGPSEPDAEVFARERLEFLSGAFAELPEVHHRALVMRELEGRSYREIGERLDLTRSAVESTLFRARRRLEQEYDDLESGRQCESARNTMATLAEGLEPGMRRRRRFVRHTRRCLICRRHARELGVAPLPHFAGLRRRAAALLPIPLFLRRATSEGGALAGSQFGSGVAERAASLLAAAALAGAGGFAVQGLGGLHSQPPDKPAAAPAAQQVPAPARESSKTGGAARHGLPPSAGAARVVKPDRRSRAARKRRHKDRFSGHGNKPTPPGQALGQAPAPAQGSAPTEQGGGSASLESRVIGAQQAIGTSTPSTVAGEALNGLSNGAAQLDHGLRQTAPLVDGTAHQVNGILGRTGLRLSGAGDGFR